MVQGEGSVEDIVRSIKYADSLNCDIMVVGRRWKYRRFMGFNSELVADTILKAKSIIISAVGHEIDYLLVIL